MLRKHRLSIQNIEDWEESVTWMLWVGFTYSWCCTGGLCLCCVSALLQKRLPFLAGGKAFPCLWTWLRMGYMKVFWLPVVVYGVSPSGSSSWEACVPISPSCKNRKVPTLKQSLHLAMEGTVFTSLQGWLIRPFSSSNHLSIMSSRQQMIL